MRLRVLVVDDSAVVRQAMTRLLTVHAGMDVTVAADPIIAQDKMARERPDVVVLDLQLPRMDGLTFLRQLMREPDPVPVVVCSNAAARDAELAFQSIHEGAVDVIARPRLDVDGFLEEALPMLVDVLRAAADARGRLPRKGLSRSGTPSVKLAVPTGSPRASVIALGASTGGPEALERILTMLPVDAPGTLVVQHMPAGFTAAFARRLNQQGPRPVKEAEDGELLRPGVVLIAPGDRHMRVRRTADGYRVGVTGGPLVSRHRPSVDVLFESVAEAAGPAAVGVLLTGMGNDGAEGLLRMRRTGAVTLAQDEASCVVFGMPKEAISLGAVDHVLPLERLPGGILEALTRSAKRIESK